eukprot:jgi/Tetstr1/421261/TSEL_001134.t1
MDLSQAVFVFTFNDVDAIHPILNDRMLCIETKAYTFPKKYEIARRHLLPNICKDHGFREDQFNVSMLTPPPYSAIAMPTIAPSSIENFICRWRA